MRNTTSYQGPVFPEVGEHLARAMRSKDGARLRVNNTYKLVPELCTMITEIVDATKVMSARIRCSHKLFPYGSGERGNYGLVYVVHAAAARMVKIGYTAPDRLENRMRDLQTGSPVRLELIAIATGGTQLECHWHKEFRSLRRHMEWFDDAELLPKFRDAMAGRPVDGCARCVLMSDRVPGPGEPGYSHVDHDDPPDGPAMPWRKAKTRRR